MCITLLRQALPAKAKLFADTPCHNFAVKACSGLLQTLRKVCIILLAGLPVRKKTVYSTLSSESPVKAFEAGGSCRSESQSSSLTSLIVSNSQFVEQSSYSSKMSNDIQSPLPQSLYRSLSDKIQNPVTQTQYLCSSSTSDYIHRTPPKEFSEFVATEDRSEIDIEPDELSLTLSQTALTSNLTRGTIIFNILLYLMLRN